MCFRTKQIQLGLAIFRDEPINLKGGSLCVGNILYIENETY